MHGIADFKEAYEYPKAKDEKPREMERELEPKDVVADTPPGISKRTSWRSGCQGMDAWHGRAQL